MLQASSQKYGLLFYSIQIDFRSSLLKETSNHFPFLSCFFQSFHMSFELQHPSGNSNDGFDVFDGIEGELFSVSVRLQESALIIKMKNENLIQTPEVFESWLRYTIFIVLQSLCSVLYWICDTLENFKNYNSQGAIPDHSSFFQSQRKWAEWIPFSYVFSKLARGRVSVKLMFQTNWNKDKTNIHALIGLSLLNLSFIHVSTFLGTNEESSLSISRSST